MTLAMARSQLYRLFSTGLRYPDAGMPAALRRILSDGLFLEACRRIDREEKSRMQVLAKETADCWNRESDEAIQAAHIRTFGHTAQSQIPLYETEYGDAQSLRGLQDLADIAGFYRAFGLQVEPANGERVDHAAVEAGFLHFLCFKEDYALLRHGKAQQALCRDTQKKFLRDHFGAWAPSMARRILDTSPFALYTALARFLREFLRLEAARFGLAQVSESLGLRLPDTALESDCTSCMPEKSCPGGTDALAVRSTTC